jgi:hypothetical protein
LALLVAGRWVVRKLLRVAWILLSMIKVRFSRASSAVLKGWNATNLTILANLSRLEMDF